MRKVLNIHSLIGHLFLFSANSQEQARDNEDVARWYSFVNTEAYKEDYSILAISKKSSEKNKLFKDLPYQDDNDIKIVVVYNGTDVPVRMDSAGRILKKDSKEGFMVHASLPLANEKYADPKYAGSNRFSFKSFEEKYIAENKATAEEAGEASKAALKKALVEYENFRKSILKSDKALTLNIEAISAGKKIKTDAIVDINEGLSVNPVFSVYTIVTPEKKDDETGEIIDQLSVRNVSGSEGLVRAGFTYVYYNNKLVLVRPKTLSQTGDVDNI